MHGQQVPGPMNITRDEGWTDEPVECPFQAPIWAINSTLFEPLALMSPLIPTTSGLTIEVVERSLNNTTFQCFSLNGTELDVHKSQVGTLSVIKKGMIIKIIIIILLIELDVKITRWLSSSQFGACRTNSS